MAARCDGHLALAEKSWIENHFESRYRHDFVLFNCAKRLLRVLWSRQRWNVDACLIRINQEFTAGHKVALMKMAYEIAAAAGPINQKESRFLHKICERLRVPAPVPQVADPTPASASTASRLPAPSKISAPSLSRLPTASRHPPPAALDQQKATNTVDTRAAAAKAARAVDLKHGEIDAKPRRVINFC